MDVTFQAAVAQAELESREYPGFYHRLCLPHHRPRARCRGCCDPVRPLRTVLMSALSTTPVLNFFPRVSLRLLTLTTSATSLGFGTTVAFPVFGVEVLVLPTPRRK